MPTIPRAKTSASGKCLRGSLNIYRPFEREEF